MIVMLIKHIAYEGWLERADMVRRGHGHEQFLTITQHLFFIPYVVFTAAFHSQTLASIFTNQFISTGGKDILSVVEC